jgi:hypothetical protein
MGSSRSWAADMEDEEKTCKFGVVTKYFDTCVCVGCKALRQRDSRLDIKAREVMYIARELFAKTPDEQWDNITSIKLKR